MEGRTHVKVMCFMVGAALVAFAASSAHAQSTISVRVNVDEIPSGGTFYTPLNNGTSTVAVFSEQLDNYTITNLTAGVVTINSITFAHADRVMEEEFTLRDASDLAYPPLVVSDLIVEAGATFDFYIRFFPVSGGLRSTTVTITYNTAETFTYTVQGQGHPLEIDTFSHGTLDWAESIGGDFSDELTTGMVMDDGGNVYFAGNVAQVVNEFAHDIFVGRMNADGSLAWLKIWSGNWQDYSRDPGQNAETGGSADAIAIDDEGFIYLVGSHSATSSNSTFWTLILKINPADGSLVWQQVWAPDSSIQYARHSNEGYAVDIDGDSIFVTGVTGGNAEVLLISLDRNDGSVRWERSLDAASGSNDRGYAIRADGSGNLYVGGLTNGRGLLMRLVDIHNPAGPTLDWARRIDMGRGSNVSSIDVDMEGHAYLSCDRRGANTYFSAMRVDSDGNVAWARTYNPEASNDQDNTHVIRVFGDDVFVGGRGGVSQFDAQQGDGLLLRLNRSDGSLQWAALYFTGRGPDELCEHRIKGIAMTPTGQLYVMGQSYSGSLNHTRFWGYWYDGTVELVEYPAGTNVPDEYQVTDITAEVTMTEAEESAGVQDPTTLDSYNSYLDAPMEAPLGDNLEVMTHQPLSEDEGTAPDGEVFIMRITLE